MSFWENIGETLSTKGKEVADKAKNLTDIAGLKGQIVTCENTITKNYKEIGKAYYEAHKNDAQPEFEENMNAIANAENAILELEKKINALKGTKHCAACGADVAEDCTYCPKCGAKMEDEFFDEEGDNTELKNIIKEDDIVD